MTIQSILRRLASARAVALLLGALAAVPAMAAIELRVEARPLSDPIQAYVSVTTVNGDPIVGLTSSDFTVTIDNVPVGLVPTDVTLPPNQDPSQKISVVFAMDYSRSVTDIALVPMQTAVIDFVDNLNIGDFASIIKFNNTNPLRASVVQGFTQIDQAQGNLDLHAAVMADYPGNGTNLLDAINLAVDQFVTPPPPVVLPTGPKVIVIISDGGENESLVEQSDVIEYANANSIAVFSIGVGDLTIPGRAELLGGLAVETGGAYFPTTNDTEIADAYTAILTQLGNEYLITIPSGIADCGVHTMQVAVPNQTAVSVQFTRRICDTEPNPFSFTNETGVALGSAVTSNAVTVTGIEVPAEISVQIGTYSIGCTDANFTRDPGTINDGETVCVRHNASAAPTTTNTTTLTIGGVSGTFTSTTRAIGGGGGGGGGGATGGLELLAGLAALFARRRRRI